MLAGLRENSVARRLDLPFGHLDWLTVARHNRIERTRMGHKNGLERPGPSGQSFRSDGAKLILEGIQARLKLRLF